MTVEPTTFVEEGTGKKEELMICKLLPPWICALWSRDTVLLVIHGDGSKYLVLMLPRHNNLPANVWLEIDPETGDARCALTDQERNTIWSVRGSQQQPVPRGDEIGVHPGPRDWKSWRFLKPA